MTLTLILIRHAKSDWGNADISDHDRPLNTRGQDAAPRVGTYLAAKGFEPKQVLCSTARRTQETWAGVASRLDTPPDPTLTHALYGASAPEILRVISGCSGSGPLAVIGHNPGMGDLAQALCRTPPNHPQFASYPTGAITILDFDVADWSAIRMAGGQLRHFAVPRELP